MVMKLCEENGACLFELAKNDIKLQITNYGAAVFLVEMKDDTGNFQEITLSCDSLAEFMKNEAYFGATVGRTANRIAKGRFMLDGREYQLSQNEGQNSAHGGFKGFSSKLWDAEITGESEVTFSLVSPDGDEGYPGELDTSVCYSLSEEGEITITHKALSNADTLVSYTNHTYWSLCGSEENVNGELLVINGEKYLETDEDLIPTGRILPVCGTPYDFTSEHTVGERISEDFAPLKRNYGYDVSFVKRGEGMGLAARLKDERTRRSLEVYTSYPDIHLYTGNFLDGVHGRGGRTYARQDALCLEGSFFPDAVNHPGFGGMLLKKGEQYCETIKFKLYRF